ncbi:MAG: PQQ-binding-like beta-propeller repeat protein [Phycisphaerales bacterium]|nr:PQQ-binding-like beta-propeller repeat protein [Phycisphaerales bacterium]
MLRPAPMVLIAVLLVLTASAAAALDPTWVRTHVTGSELSPRGLAVDEDGGIYTLSAIGSGSASDLLVTKFDDAGELVWETIYAGPEGQDVALDVVLAADQASLYAVGRSSVPGFGNSDYAIIKYDAATGVETWRRFYNGPASGIDDPRAVAATPDGGVVVTGGVWNDDERTDYGTVKFDAAGDQVWEAIFGDNGPFLFNDDRGTDIIVTGDGDVVVSGTTRPAASGNDVVTFRYDGETGAVEWMSRYSTSANESVNDLALTPKGDVIVFGTDPFGLDRRWLVVRYDGVTGEEQWTRLYDPGWDEGVAQVVVDADGDVYVTGSTDPDGDDSNFNENLVVIALDGGTGTVRWVDEFGGSGTAEADFGRDLILDDAGHLYVVGSTRTDAYVPTAFDADALIIKYDTTDGARLDIAVVDTTEAGGMVRTDSFHRIRADGHGNLFTSGLSDGDVFVEPRLLVAGFMIGTVPGDVDGDGAVGFADLLAVLSAWGPCPGCAADLNGDEMVDFIDLLIVLSGWTS